MTTEQTAATECAFADEGCTCGRPSLRLTAEPRPVPSPEDRMAAARTDRDYADRIPAPRPLPTDRTNGHHRDLHQHIAGLEADLRSQTRAVRELAAERDQARQVAGIAADVLATIRDAAERIDRALAVYDTTPGETCSPPCTLPKGHPNECDANAPALGSAPPRAQEPGAWMNRRAVVSDALGRALTARGYDVPLPVRDRCAEAVLAAQDADHADRLGRP